MNFWNRIKILWRLNRSLENPNVSLQDPEAWNDIFGGENSASGISINRSTALTCAAVFRAESLISSDVAKLPLHLYRRIGEGKERAVDHPVYNLLRRKPNPETTSYIFRQTLTGHVLSVGNGYAYIERDGGGMPLALWILDSQATSPIKVNGTLWYTTKIKDIDFKFSYADVLHIRGLGYDGMTGYSVLDKARESLGLGMAASRYTSKFYANNAEPRTVIQFPVGVKISPEAQKEFLRQWNDMHQGLENAHKTALITGGGIVNPYSINAKDAQLLESRQFEIREVANWFGLPPHKLGDTTRTAYASLEQENQAYLDQAIDPWLCNWEAECSDKLLSEEEKRADSHFVEFSRAALIRADTKTETESLVEQVNNGLISVDEARSVKNLPPIPNGDGQKYRKPVNIGYIDDPAPIANPPAAVPDPATSQKSRHRLLEAHRKLLVDACRRAIKRLSTHARKAANKPETFDKWLDNIESEHGADIRDILRPSADACLAVTGDDAQGVDAVADELLKSFHAGLSLLIEQCTRKELLDRVNALMDSHERFGPEALADSIIKKEERYDSANN